MNRWIAHSGRAATVPALGVALALGAALALVPAGADGQQDFSDVEFETVHVAGSVYALISGRGGNIGVSSGPDGTLIVDDQFAPLADKIRAALREIGQSEEAADVRFVLNTHYHGDHTGGNVEFGEEATIVAQANVRRRLATPQERGGQVTPASPTEALPVITFDEALSVHLNGEEIEAFHVPHGHTDGDAIIWFTGSNVIHMGDDFFAGRFPFVDLAAGGSVEGLERGIASLLEEIPADASIIPGHGPVSTVDDLRLYHRMLRETIAMVRDKMEAGMSPEDIRAGGVPSAWEGWGDGFISTERWLDTIQESLSGSGAGGYVEHGHEDVGRGATGAGHGGPHAGGTGGGA